MANLLEIALLFTLLLCADNIPNRYSKPTSHSAFRKREIVTTFGLEGESKQRGNKKKEKKPDMNFSCILGKNSQRETDFCFGH